MKPSSMWVAGALVGLGGCGFSSADQLFEGRAGAAGASGKAGSAGSRAGSGGVAGAAAGTSGAAGVGVGGTSGSAGAGVGGKAGKGGAPPVDCSGQGKGCQQCCDEQTDGVVTQAFILACGCDKGAECGKPCGSNLCSGKQPSGQCAGCLNNVDDDAPCVQTFEQTCSDDPACAAALGCFQACP